MRTFLWLLPALALACVEDDDKDEGDTFAPIFADDTSTTADDTGGGSSGGGSGGGGGGGGGGTDADGDGYDSTVDCDDSDANINPGATEVCDEIDNDCDGDVDEGVATTYYADVDCDGFGDAASSVECCSRPTGYAPNGDDCDDYDAAVYPGATEVCDKIDNDCDGDVDEGC